MALSVVRFQAQKKPSSYRALLKNLILFIDLSLKMKAAYLNEET